MANRRPDRFSTRPVGRCMRSCLRHFSGNGRNSRRGARAGLPVRRQRSRRPPRRGARWSLELRRSRCGLRQAGVPNVSKWHSTHPRCTSGVIASMSGRPPVVGAVLPDSGQGARSPVNEQRTRLSRASHWSTRRRSTPRARGGRGRVRDPQRLGFVHVVVAGVERDVHRPPVGFRRVRSRPPMRCCSRSSRTGRPRPVRCAYPLRGRRPGRQCRARPGPTSVTRPSTRGATHPAMCRRSRVASRRHRPVASGPVRGAGRCRRPVQPGQLTVIVAADWSFSQRLHPWAAPVGR